MDVFHLLKYWHLFLCNWWKMLKAPLNLVNIDSIFAGQKTDILSEYVS